MIKNAKKNKKCQNVLDHIMEIPKKFQSGEKLSSENYQLVIIHQVMKVNK